MLDAGTGQTESRTQQFNRVCSLVVSQGTKGIDLSDFRIKFMVKRSESAVPNTADIYVYNVDEETAFKLRSKEFTKVFLKAGYPGNEGIIFSGNIRQAIVGRESAIDTFVNLICGDGDQAYVFSVINKTLGKGSKPMDQVTEAINSMSSRGVTAGQLGTLPLTSLPRGKVMFGNSRKYLKNIAGTYLRSWSIQDGKVVFVYNTSYLPGSQVQISATTGMIGTPQQTTDGVDVKCLLNPNIQVSQRVHIDNNSILQQKLNLDQIAAARGDVSQVNLAKPRPLNATGSYYVLALAHTGDTRGLEWYTTLVTLSIDVSANPLNSVTGGVGG